jgi:hypothetical protein
MKDFLLGMILFSVSGSLLYLAFSLWLCSIVKLSVWTFIQDIARMVLKISPFILVLLALKLVNINENLKLSAAVLVTGIAFIVYLRGNKKVNDLISSTKLFQKIFPDKDK